MMTNWYSATAEELEEYNMMWSVESEVNSFNNDEFNGTFAECLAYVKEQGYKLDGHEAKIALIEVDEKGCFEFCHDEYIEEDDED